MSSHSRAITKNASIVAGATVLSRILGFLRDLVTAYALGAGPVADAFFVAFRVPNMLRRLFAEGSLTMSFIPVYARVKEEDGQGEAFALTRSVNVWLVLILAALSLLAVTFARPLTMLIAPGFTDDPELFGLTAKLTAICFPYILLASAAALSMGVLNSMGHFLSPALSPCVLNVVLICSALTGLAMDGNVAVALSVGVLVGGAGQWLVQQPYLARRGFSWRGPWSFRHKGVKRVGLLMLPTIFGAAIYQVNVLVGTLIASFLPTGSISFLYYADRLLEFPVGVIVTAITTAALPSLSGLAAAKDWRSYGETLDTALGLSLFMSLPCAAGLMTLSAPMIATLYARGAFSPADVQATAQALFAYSFALPGLALSRPLVSAFYSLEDTRTPVVIAAVCLVANVAVSLALMGPLAHVGLAAATSVSSLLNAGLLMVYLRRKLGHWPRITRAFLVSTVLSLGVGIGCYATRPLGKWSLVVIPLWAVLYIGTAAALHIPEARLMTAALWRRRR